MLGQTYMNPRYIKSVTKPANRKRHTVNLNDDVFRQLGLYVAEHGDTKENVVTRAVMDWVGDDRKKFLKAYAPQLTLEHISNTAIFINDNELNKTAVVRVQWNSITKDVQNRSLLKLYCEICESESCIHVRYSLVLPNITQMQKEQKMV